MEHSEENRNYKTHQGCRRIQFWIGCACLTFLDGLDLYWGNLAVYVYSYFLMQVYVTPANQGPWVVAMFIASRLSGMISLPSLERYVFKKWTPFVAILIANLGFFLSYFSVQCSLELLVITLCIFGFGTGIIHFWTLKEITETTALKDLGVLTAIPYVSTYCGAVVVNQILTLYINPKNVLPNVDVNGLMYFSHKNVVDKVPAAFLLLGGLSIGSKLMGFFLVKLFKYHNYINNGNERQNQLVGKEIHTYDSFTTESKNKVCETRKKSQLNNENCDNSTHNSVLELENIQSNILEQNCTSVLHSKNEDETRLQFERKQYTVREVLTSPTFYLICFVRSFVELPLILVLTYYKIFGQLWINDDHFNTNIGMATAIFSCCSRLIVGMFYDKIGWKRTFLLTTFLLFLLLIWYYFTAMTNRWIFLVFTMLMPSLSQSILTSIYPITILVFGKTNAVTITNFMRLITFMQNIVSPLFVEAVLHHVGWFYTFFTTGVGVIVAFFMLLLFFPEV